MSWRLLTVLSIGVALALLLVLGWRELAPTDLGAPPQPATDSPTATSTQLGANHRTTTDTVASAGRSEATAPVTPERRVRIVDETGAPVANAEVAFDVSRAEGAKAAVLWERDAGHDVEALMPKAPRFSSARDGMVTLPTDAERAFLIARAGERFGCGVIDFDNQLYEVPEVRIAPDTALRIIVVDPRGEACPGVPVEVVYQEEEAVVGAGTRRFLLPRTDETGCVTFWHAQTLDYWNRADPSVELRAQVVGASPPAERVRLVERRPDVIRLVCPQHGGIRVRAWFAKGVPSEVHFHPNLYEIVQGEEVMRDNLVAPGRTRAELLLFPVATGRRWKVDAHGFGECQCDGPADRSEVVVDLVANDSQRPVTGLLLRPDGSPCASMPIRLSTFPHGDDTDAAGRFHIAIDPKLAAFTVAVRELRAMAQIPLPTTEATGPVVDLGVIRLLPQELLVAGKVIDATTKQPLRAFLSVNRRTGSWIPDPFQFSATDGSFELWGPAVDEVVVDVRKNGYATSVQSIVRGSRDVVVALQRALQLRATVLVDSDITVDGLGVSVRDGDHRVSWETSHARPGQFTCLFMLPDDDDLVLEVAGDENLPAVRKVPRSEWTTRDGVSCATVDLRNALAITLLTIRRSAAGGEGDGSLYLRQLDGSTSWSSLPLWPRQAFAFPKGTVMDAIVRPDSGMCLRTTLHPGENTIDIPPPSVAQLDVTGLPPEIERKSIEVEVWRLVRREPLLDELLASGLDDIDPGAVRDWPRSDADLEKFAFEDLLQQDAGQVLQELGAGPKRIALWRRGSYVAMPFVVANGDRIALFDAAVALEITTPGVVVDATIRLDPEKVRAAIR